MPAPSAPSSGDRPAAVLVAVQLPGVTDEELAADLAELARLAHTFGLDVVATVTQRRSSLAPGAVLGEGKLKELADLTGGKGYVPSPAPKRKSKARARLAGAADRDGQGEHGAGRHGREDAHGDEGDDGATDAMDDEQGGEHGAASTAGRKPTVVVVDHEITPSQLRNLERATGAEVLDRTGLIVEIFHRHARSREAKLQVEIARLTYIAPRLREAGAGADRQRGGIGGKGAGESALELDRRRIRDRIAELRQQIAAIQNEQQTRRAHRRDARRVALVGYTNAGKSSLMRALTGSDVLVADKLFATLDTTVRALHPETRPRILVSDTVGFIKKLPHDLVASFRSTLDEALEASLLLYVADAADPTFRSQLEVTRSVLAEIGASDVPSRLVLNKADRLTEIQRRELAREFPEAVVMSAKLAADVTALRERIVAFFEASMEDGEIFVPYAKQAIASEVYEGARVLSEEYDEAGARLRVRAHPATLARLRTLLAS